MKRKLDENDVPAPVPTTPGTTAVATPAPASFKSLGLDARLEQAIANEGFKSPTPIQVQAIPLALQGKDVVARAYTGSGKTAAYLLPVLQSMLQTKQHDTSKATRALVLVPTKELAQQVHQVIGALCAFCARAVRSLNLSQKTSDIAQRSFLAEAPELIVGTPAAVHGAVRAATLHLDHIKHVVIDEADLVLAYGHEEDLKFIAQALPPSSQKILMSATLALEVESLKDLFCQDPVLLEVDEAPDRKERVQQYFVNCGEEEKFLLLYVILKLKLITGKVLVFVEDVDRCYRLKLYLEQFGIKACILNPELPVNSRIHTVEQFNKNVYDIIIGSDELEVLGNEQGKTHEPAQMKEPGNGVTNGSSTASPAKKARTPKKRRDKEYGISRGLDFRRVSCVLNFDLPRSASSYTHRIGRTARGGATGLAFSFVIPASKQGKSKHCTLASTMSDPTTLASITADQKSKDKTIQEYVFDEKRIDPFRYRAMDALKLVTRKAVGEARAREIRAELINSEKLKRHFEENPDDLKGLRHDESRSKRVLAHLKDVPEYLLPPKDGTGARTDVGFVGITKGRDKERRGKRGQNHGRSGRGRGKVDPLRDFNVRGRRK